MKFKSVKSLSVCRLFLTYWYGACRRVYRDYLSLFSKLYSPVLQEQVAALCCDLNVHKRDEEEILHRLTHEGFSFLGKTLAEFSKNIERSIAQGRYIANSSFRVRKNRILPDFLGSYLSDIFFADGFLKPNACPVAVYAIRQICNFFTKIADFPSCPSKDKLVVDSFVSTDKTLEFCGFDHEFFGFFRSCVHRLFSGFKPGGGYRHGPGVCSNVGEDRISKNHKILDNIPSTWISPISHFYNQQDFWENYHRIPQSSIFDLGRLSTFGQDTPANIAKVILVPKDFRGPRLISCEPMENQYVQQALLREFVSTIESDEFLAGQVNFSSQQVNRDLAALASQYQTFSTLDLKEASDRVHFNFVYAFPSEIRDLLINSRSSGTLLPNGNVVTLNKFAPMGSAVCFPVLALLGFYASVYGLVKFGGYTPLKAMKSVFVYGDDIIVPTDGAPHVLRGLEIGGLLVNTNKSFIGSRFAESCGFDGFDGNDVTPIRCRSLPPFLSAEESNSIVKAVELGNNLKSSGLKRSAELFYSYAERVIGRLPWALPTTPYLGRDAKPWEKDGRALKHQKGRLCFRVLTETAEKGESPYGWLRRKPSRTGSWKDLFDPPVGTLGLVDIRRIFLKKSRISWKDFPF